MKNLFIFLVSLASLNCFAGELVCEAWFQESGTAIERQLLDVTSITNEQIIFTTSFKGFEFEVKWHFELTTLYTLIKKDRKNVLFTTARVPTENHPEAFTDLNIPNGPRLSLNCEVR